MIGHGYCAACWRWSSAGEGCADLVARRGKVRGDLVVHSVDMLRLMRLGVLADLDALDLLPHGEFGM
jgi:hypothetical protein